MSQVNPSCRRRSASPPPDTAAPTEDENLLPEVLLRLPARPSSLPRASLVCKRWRQVAADPQFRRRFCAHHREPPIIGVFLDFYRGELSFRSVLDPPDQIPSRRFSLRLDGIEGGCKSNTGIWSFRGCRHGLVVLTSGDHLGKGCREVLVWDPVTGEQRFISGPPPQPGHDWGNAHVQADVLCVAADEGHVHGACHSSPFKVVLVSMYGHDNRSLARVYSSATATWGNPISTDAPYDLRGDARKQPTLVGNALYWLSNTDGILKFDLDEQSLTVIEQPPIARSFHIENRKIVHAEDGSIGFAILAYPHFRMWRRNVNLHGVATWAPWKTIAIPVIDGLPPQINGMQARLLGYDEDAEVLFFHLVDSVYLVQLKSAQYKKLYETSYARNLHFFPFSSFYTPGTAVANGFNGAEVLHIG